MAPKLDLEALVAKGAEAVLKLTQLQMVNTKNPQDPETSRYHEYAQVAQ